MASSSTGTIVKVGLLGVGGYLLYRYLVPSTVAAAAAPAAAPTATVDFSLTDLVDALKAAVSNSGTPAPPATAPATADTADVQSQKVLAQSGGDPNALYTASQWNYFYQQVYGVPGQPLGDDGSPMNVAAYFALRSSNGLSGFGGPIPLRRPVLVANPGGAHPTVMLPGRTVRLRGGR